jgi:DNA sulfur modification protein DndE
MPELPPEQVAAMDAKTFFSYFANLLKSNPPAAADASMVIKLSSVGIIPGGDFDFSKLDPIMKTGLSRSVIPAKIKIRSFRSSREVNRWNFNLDLGSYGTNYLLRASTAMFGLGANIAVDSIYLGTSYDSQVTALTGSQRYVIHFSAAHTPPANAFWSLTLYNYRQFFASNTLNRYAIHSVDNLTYNADGSLDLFIQSDSPGPEKETNWLPSPREKFYLVIRIYWPKPEALDGRWKPPAVQRVN